jgi:hypothetical protein
MKRRGNIEKPRAVTGTGRGTVMGEERTEREW